MMLTIHHIPPRSIEMQVQPHWRRWGDRAVLFALCPHRPPDAEPQVVCPPQRSWRSEGLWVLQGKDVGQGSHVFKVVRVCSLELGEQLSGQALRLVRQGPGFEPGLLPNI